MIAMRSGRRGPWWQGLEEARPGDVRRVRWEEGEYTPAVDLYDTGDTLTAKVDIPDVAPEDVEVTVQEGRVLTVKAHRPAEGVEQERYLCCERPAGRFARTIELPVEVDAEGVTARLRLGVLEIVLPKSKAAVPRKVAVSVS